MLGFNPALLGMGCGQSSLYAIGDYPIPRTLFFVVWELDLAGVVHWFSCGVGPIALFDLIDGVIGHKLPAVLSRLIASYCDRVSAPLSLRCRALAQ